MRVDISSLIKNDSVKLSFAEDVAVPGSYALSSAEVNVSFDGKLSFKGGVYILRGVLQAAANKACDRCLKETQIEIKASVLEQYKTSGDDDEYIIFQGDYIDLSEALLTNLLLNIPVKALCCDDCKGLCPICGLDLNVGECLCNAIEIKNNSLFEDKEV